MHEGRGLQRMSGGFARHLGRRKLAQLAINERKQLRARDRVSLGHFLQDYGDFTGGVHAPQT